LLDKIPLDKVPEAVKDALSKLKQKVNEFFAKTKKADDNIVKSDFFHSINKWGLMALEFRLSLATDFDDKQITDLILKNFNFAVKLPSKTFGDFYGDGFVCWVYQIDENRKEVISGEHGINTNICL
jgi:hypothetical protein